MSEACRSISLSPSTAESSPAATSNKCVIADESCIVAADIPKLVGLHAWRIFSSDLDAAEAALRGAPGVNPPLEADGDYLIGPDYRPAPELTAVAGVPQGKVQQFSMDSKESKFFNPGIAREVFGTVDPKNPKTLIVETHPIDYQRTITVYIPAHYVPGTAAPFIVTHDGPALGKPPKD